MVEWKKIKDVCSNICSGGTPNTKNRDYYYGDIPWLRTQEVDWGNIYDTEIKISQKGLDNSSAKIIEKDCVIVAMYGATAAKVAINKIPLSTNQACCNLKINKDISCYRYVYYWLCKEYHKLKALGEGSQNNISGLKIKDYPIPIPSLSEQKRIVGILDTFTDSIENLKQQIAERRKQIEHYREQILKDVSNKWPYVTLKDVAIIKNGKDYKKLLEGNIPVYGTGGIMTYVDQFASNQPSVLLPRKGSVDSIFYVDEPFWTVDTLYWTDINTEKIIPKYLYLSLRRYNLKDFAYGGARPSLSQPILYKLGFSLPSLEEQQRIVSILDTFEASISNLEAQLEQRQKQYEYYRNKLLSFEKEEH